MRVVKVLMGVSILAVCASVVLAQESRPLSPRGQASTQVGGSWQENAEGRSQYVDGKWIDVDYGRPILRQREGIFGSGAEYGQGVLAGAPIWRVGANVSTRFKTETALTFGGNRLEAGEYSMFIDLKENAWTLVFSNWEAKESFREENPNGLWGAYQYTDEKDVLRTPMQVSQADLSIDELVIAFADVTQSGGKLVVRWETTRGVVDFSVAQ